MLHIVNNSVPQLHLPYVGIVVINVPLQVHVVNTRCRLVNVQKIRTLTSLDVVLSSLSVVVHRWG